MPRSGMRAPWPAKMTGASVSVSTRVAADAGRGRRRRTAIGAAVARSSGAGALAGARSTSAHRLEPGAVLARRLEAAGADLRDDIVDRPGLALGARRAALKSSLASTLDMAQQIGRRDRRRGRLGGEWRRRGEAKGAAARSRGLNMALLKERRRDVASDSACLARAPWRSARAACSTCIASIIRPSWRSAPPVAASIRRAGGVELGLASGRTGGWRSRSGWDG